MKLLTTRSVDYLQSPGYDFWKETLTLTFSNISLWHCQLSASWFHYIGEKADISSANISKQSGWINSTTGQRENTYFIFLGELPLYDEEDCLPSNS